LGLFDGPKATLDFDSLLEETPCVADLTQVDVEYAPYVSSTFIEHFNEVMYKEVGGFDFFLQQDATVTLLGVVVFIYSTLAFVFLHYFTN